MTDKEALEKHKEDCKKCWDKACEHNIQCLQKKDIEVYEELLAYRAIGTVEDLKFMKENGAFSGVELVKIVCMQMKLKDYQSIGTIEEFKALKEKNTPMELAEHNFQDEVHHYLCPSCRSIVSCNQNYCEECGQALEN